MDLSSATFWWVLAGVLVAAELATNTFYLLMLALGAVSGALAAHLGLATSPQLIVAAVIAAGSTALWHWRRARHPQSAPAAHNRDVNLDIGERVTVTAWAPDRTARVPYRGSTWTARLAPDAPVLSGEHVVRGVEGNWLILAPVSAL